MKLDEKPPTPSNAYYTQLVSFKLSPAMERQIKDIAVEIRRTPSVVIRSLIAAGIEAYEADKAESAG